MILYVPDPFETCKKILPLRKAPGVLTYEKYYGQFGFNVSNIFFGVYSLKWEYRILRICNFIWNAMHIFILNKGRQ